MKTRRIAVRFDPDKRWVLTALEQLVRMKGQIGFPTTLALESARIIEDYLTGVVTGKQTDAELLSKWREEFLKGE